MSIAKQLVAQYGRAGELVDLYGVILFTDAHPNIAKVVQDEQYWRALDEITGQRWAVFCVKPSLGSTKTETVRHARVGKMIPIWDEPNENKQLIEEFEIESTQDLPILLVFTWDQESGKILKVTIAIEDSSVDLAFESLRNSISRVSRIVERTDPANRHNARELSNLVEDEEISVQSIKFIKKALPLAEWAFKIFHIL